MKTGMRWSLALGMFCLGLAASAASSADEALEYQMVRLSELREAQVAGAPFKFSSELCVRVPRLQASAADAPGAPLQRVLTAISSRNGLPVADVLPGAIESWWRRVKGHPAETLVTAIHEALHELNTVLTECDGKRPAYFLDGRVHRVERDPAYAKPYAQVASWFESRPISVTSKFRLYVANGGLAPKNDFYILLDELAAYLGAAEAELSLVEYKSGHVLNLEHVVKMQASLDGALHFKLFALVYLDMVCQESPKACPTAATAPKGLRDFIRTLLTITDERLAWRQRIPVWQQDLLLIEPAVFDELKSPALVALEQLLREP